MAKGQQGRQSLLFELPMGQQQDLKSEMEQIFMKSKGTYNLLRKYIDLPEMIQKRKSWKKQAKETVVTKGGTIAALNKLTLFVLSSDSEEEDSKTSDISRPSTQERIRQVLQYPTHKNQRTINNKLHVPGRFNLR